MDKPMRDNPVHTFLLFLTGQIPDQIAAGQMRWVTVAVYWLLAVAGIGIAVFNWRRDTTQRSTHHLLILAMRYLGGAMFSIRSGAVKQAGLAALRLRLAEANSSRPHFRQRWDCTYWREC